MENYSADNEGSTAINELKEAVKNLKLLKEEKRTEAVKKSIGELETVFQKHKEVCLANNKAQYWHLFGQVYGTSSDYSAMAIECYSKAVKLDPSMITAWNDLGELYWRKEEKDMAKSCFERALLMKKNIVSLRNLSLIWRNEAQNSNVLRKENIDKSINFAKQALNLDITDGHSWTVLGNAYLTYFFIWGQEKSYVDQAIQAYTQAERTVDARKNPEVHHNKGVALKFNECYKEAFDCFVKALEIDNNFEFAASKLSSMIAYLDQIQSLNDTKGKLRPRRLKAFVQDLRKNKSLKMDKPRKALIDLGRNNGDVYSDGKVIWSSLIDESFPFTFGLMDVDETVAVVTVYNLAHGKGVIIGDTVAILSPEAEYINISCGDKDYKFVKIRVNDPLTMVVNRRLLPLSYKSDSSMSTMETR